MVILKHNEVKISTCLSDIIQYRQTKLALLYLYHLFFYQVNSVFRDTLFGLLHLIDSIGADSPQRVLGLVAELLRQFRQILPVFSSHPESQIYV